MQKRDGSNLSPLENNQSIKKMNLDEENTTIDDLVIGEQENKNPNMPNSSLKQIIGPLIDKVKALRESFHSDYNKLDKKVETVIEAKKGEFTKLEATISTQNTEVTSALSYKIETNPTNINQLLEENRLLKRENDSL